MLQSFHFYFILLLSNCYFRRLFKILAQFEKYLATNEELDCLKYRIFLFVYTQKKTPKNKGLRLISLINLSKACREKE